MRQFLLDSNEIQNLDSRGNIIGSRGYSVAFEVTKFSRPVFVTDGGEYKLRIDRADKIPPGNEYYVSVVIDGEQFEGIVPTAAVQDNGILLVSGTLVGRIGDHVLISLSPSSMGTSTWTIHGEAVEKVKFSG